MSTVDGSGDVSYTKLPAVERNLANGRLLVQPIDAGKAVQLSGSAPLIWDLLDAHHNVVDIVTRLEERFTDPTETIATGVSSALELFVSQRLVVIT